TKIGDERGQAMVLNALGGVYQRQGRFDDATDAFQKSLELGKEMATHRAMVLSSWGKALLDHDQTEQAIEKLRASFEIEEQLRKTIGLRVVTPPLVRALMKVDLHEEALQYSLRALAIAPDDKRLLKVQEQLSQLQSISTQTSIKTGRIKRT